MRDTLRRKVTAGMDSEVAQAQQPSGWRNSPRLRALARVAPWLSLAISLVGALWMERDHDAAALVAAAVAGSSLTMTSLLWLRRRHAAQAPQPVGMQRVAAVAGVVATQSLAQVPLFFSAAFYLLAFAYTPLQFVFLVLFAAAVVAVSWDPLAYALLPHRYVGAPLVSFCSFVGLRAALPMLGVPAAAALAVSALAVALLTVWDLRVRWPEASWRKRVGAALALSLALLAIAPAMPAAPLRLVRAGLGTGVQQRLLQNEAERFEVGTRLYCYTAVFSPRHTEATLVHHWTRDGAALAELELAVQGGRPGGFRTWSRVHAARPGAYRCEVRNALGQVLGRLTAEVR